MPWSTMTASSPAKRRVVGPAVRHRRGDRWLVPSWCCRPSPPSVVRPGRGADQEAAGALVGRGPDQVADALEAEHRVVDVERQHRQAVRRVRRRRRRPRRERAGLGDAFLEDLAALVLAVGEHRARVLRLVELPERRVDAELAEQARHAEGARLVGDDRHDARPERRVLQQVAEQAHERHRGAHLLAVGVQREAPLAARAAAPAAPGSRCAAPAASRRARGGGCAGSAARRCPRRGL